MTEKEKDKEMIRLAQEYEKIPGARCPHDWGFHPPGLDEMYEDLKKCVAEGKRYVREPLPEGALE